jgi:hypothetical protein
MLVEFWRLRRAWSSYQKAKKLHFANQIATTSFSEWRMEMRPPATSVDLKDVSKIPQLA